MGVQFFLPPHELSKVLFINPRRTKPQHLVLRTGFPEGIGGPEGRKTCMTPPVCSATDITLIRRKSRTWIGWSNASSKTTSPLPRRRAYNRSPSASDIKPRNPTKSEGIVRWAHNGFSTIAKYLSSRHSLSVTLPGLSQRSNRFPSDWYYSEGLYHEPTPTPQTCTVLVYLWQNGTPALDFVVAPIIPKEVLWIRIPSTGSRHWSSQHQLLEVTEMCYLEHHLHIRLRLVSRNADNGACQLVRDQGDWLPFPPRGEGPHQEGGA